MSFRNRKLHLACIALMSAVAPVLRRDLDACRKLARDVLKQPPPPMVLRQILRTELHAHPWNVVESRKEEIQALPEFLECAELMKSSRRISRHFDEMIHVGQSAYRLGLAEQCLMTFVQEVLERSVPSGRLKIDTAYGDMEQFFYCNQVPYIDSLLLANFVAEKDEIVLQRDLEIVKIPDWQGMRLWSQAAVLGDDSFLEAFLYSSFSVRLRYLLPKRVVDQVPSANRADRSAARRPSQDRLLTLLAVVTALRLFGKGIPLATATVTAPAGIQPVGAGPMRSLRTLPSFLRGHYFLDEASARSLPRFWHQFAVALSQGRKDLSLAVRRFNFALERDLLEDSLIDHMIALEAMYVGDEGPGEVRYRLCHRAALFLRRQEDQRKSISDMLKAAYTQRSKIVHGGEADKKVKIHGRSVEFRELIDMVEDTIRESLVKFVRLAASKGKGARLIDWDRVIYS